LNAQKPRVQPDDFSTAHRRIWAIAGPAILANSSAPLVGLVDTWAIGHLPSPVHLAAVGVGSVIFNYLLWAFGFLRMGTTGLIAQAYGKNDNDLLTATIIRSCGLALLFGFGLLIFQQALLAISLQAMAPPGEVAQITSEYFHIRIWAAPATLMGYAITGVLFGLARVKTILYLQLFLNITNAVLNVVFVIGFDMGVPGVALGTLIAQWLTLIASVWVVLHSMKGSQLWDKIRSRATWQIARFTQIISVNGFIFVRTIFLMTALAMVMRIAGGLGEVEMAASHVAMQFMLLIALGLDGFAHAAEALAGAAWGNANRAVFRRWSYLTTIWAIIASLIYSLLFWVAGDAITAMLTNIIEVRSTMTAIMPLIIALPIVSILSYQFDGIFIGATAGAAMMVTMGISFVGYLLILQPMATAWGLYGLWGAVLVFMGLRGLTQALYYPVLERKLQ
jgi:MATE family multidrug resistance protein